MIQWLIVCILASNKTRPSGVIPTFRSMPNHDESLVSIIASGNYATIPSKVINDKAVQVNVFCFLPYLQDVIDMLQEEGRISNSAASRGAAGSADGTGSATRDWIIISGNDLSYTHIKNCLANVDSCGKTMFTVLEVGSQPAITMEAKKWLELLE